MERRTYGWLSIIILCLCPSANASSSVLWQIGKFDDSSSEFAHAGRWLQAGRVVYVVGKSTPGKDWPFFQPGSANGKDGDRPHPCEIAFNLDGTPRGLYTLKVGLLVENPRLSRLEVEVNGHPALFYQHPQLNYAGGDRPLASGGSHCVGRHDHHRYSHSIPEGWGERVGPDGYRRAFKSR